MQLSDASAAPFQILGSASSPSSRRPPAGANTFDEDIVDAREIDKALSELAAISGRWNLFRKFLFDRLSVSNPKFATQHLSSNVYRTILRIRKTGINVKRQSTSKNFLIKSLTLRQSRKNSGLSNHPNRANLSKKYWRHTTFHSRFGTPVLSSTRCGICIRTLTSKLRDFAGSQAFNSRPFTVAYHYHNAR